MGGAVLFAAGWSLWGLVFRFEGGCRLRGWRWVEWMWSKWSKLVGFELWASRLLGQMKQRAQLTLNVSAYLIHQATKKPNNIDYLIPHFGLSFQLYWDSTAWVHPNIKWAQWLQLIPQSLAHLKYFKPRADYTIQNWIPQMFSPILWLSSFKLLPSQCYTVL